MPTCRLCNDPHQPMYRVLDMYECGTCGLLQRHGVTPKNGYTTGHLRPAHIPDLIATVQALQDPGTAIDVGCNDGTFALLLRDAGYSVTGVEPCEEVAAKARAWGLVVPSLEGIEPAATVWCRHVLEHVDNLPAFMAHIADALVPGGLFVLELPDCDEAMRLGSPAILWDEHLSYFTRAHVDRLIEQSGYEVLARRQYAFGGGSSVWVARHA